MIQTPCKPRAALVRGPPIERDNADQLSLPCGTHAPQCALSDCPQPRFLGSRGGMWNFCERKRLKEGDIENEEEGTRQK